MNILICGSCISAKFENLVADLSAASNQFQLNMIQALKKHGTVKTLSFINIDCGDYYPAIKTESAEEGIECFYTKKGLLHATLSYQKRLRELIKWADLVIAYNVMYPWLNVAKLSKSAGTRSTIVLADLTPPEEHTNKLRKIYSKLMIRCVKTFDKAVLLSEGSRKYVVATQDCVVVNGCIRWENFEQFTPPNNGEKKVILYTGLIAPVTGIEHLIDAFSFINDPDVVLQICGRGDEELESRLRNKSKDNSRIIWKGFLRRDEYFNALMAADILVNPRDMSMLQNQNNFPSKVLEYLATGRRIVSTKFVGWEQYQNNMDFSDSTVIELAKTIDYSLKKDDSSVEELYKRNRDLARELTWEKCILWFM